MADNLKQRLDDMAGILMEHLCTNAIEDWHPVIHAMLLEAVRAALAEPDEWMITAFRAITLEKPSGELGALARQRWNAMAAARLREIE